MQSLQQLENSRLPEPPTVGEVPLLFDPALLRAARHIYRTYYEVHPEEIQRPLGVAISRTNHRGKLIFNGRPVLLPHECFIPLNQIEPGLH